MENLSIRHNTYAKFRKGIGILFVICGIFYLILVIKEPTALHIILGIFWILMGIAYFATASSSDISSIKIEEGNLVVKWMNWYRSRTFRIQDLILITLKRTEILIDIKDKKRVKLPIDFFETEKKKEAYIYFISLTGQMNIPLEKKDLDQGQK